MTNKFPNLGKTYSHRELAEVQADFEKARLGSSYASKQRTVAMVERLNAERERKMGGK